jgi:hypothetical protein
MELLGSNRATTEPGAPAVGGGGEEVPGRDGATAPRRARFSSHHRGLRKLNVTET